SFWQALEHEPARGAAFDAHLEGWVREWSPAVVADSIWDTAQRVVDVGGGSGAFAATLLEAHPHLSVVVLDLPETAGRARAHLDARGVGARAEIAGQSFFEPLPAGADTYVLAQVLHDWT